MSSEIVFLITEQRNKQRITLPSGHGAYRFGRSAQCEYVLRRNNVGDRQFTIACADDRWTVTDDSGTCSTWYNNRYLNAGEACALQPGDVIGLNTDGEASTQEITFRVEEIRTVQGGGDGCVALGGSVVGNSDGHEASSVRMAGRIDSALSA